MENSIIPMELGIQILFMWRFIPNVSRECWVKNFLSIVNVAVSSDIKRKGVGEQQEELTISSLGQSKTQRLDYGQESFIEDENEPDRRCVDLIVLGISYRSIEADVKKCFEAFGELVFCEVRKKKGSNTFINKIFYFER
jgi:hypothetical protein